MTTTETIEAPARAETADLLARVGALTGIDVLSVARVRADPGFRACRPSDPRYRPSRPLRFSLRVGVPDDHPLRAAPWHAETVTVEVTSARLRNPRTLDAFVLGYAVHPVRPLERPLTAEDGHQIVKTLHELCDLNEGKTDHAR